MNFSDLPAVISTKFSSGIFIIFHILYIVFQQENEIPVNVQ